jgi:hypothetical protein
MTNPYDGTAAQAVPLNVEKLPLFRWRPGTRLLVVGSRDGAAPDDDLARHEGTSFRRPVTAGLLAAAQEKSGTSGLCLAYSTTLAFPQAAAAALAARRGALAVCANGWGDAGLLERLLPEADAWQLVVGPTPGPLAARILAAGAHVEALVCWSDPERPLPDLDWPRAQAVHLAPLAQADATDVRLQAAWAAARARLPAGIPLYDETHRRDDCSCGATLVWRAGGRSRLDALGGDGACRSCGCAHAFRLG